MTAQAASATSMLPIAGPSEAPSQPLGRGTAQKPSPSTLPFHAFMQSAGSAEDKASKSRKKEENAEWAPETGVAAPVKDAVPPRVWSLPQAISAMQLPLATSNSPNPQSADAINIESIERIASSSESKAAAPQNDSARVLPTLTLTAKSGNKSGKWYEDQTAANSGTTARPQLISNGPNSPAASIPLALTLETGSASSASSESPGVADSADMADVKRSLQESNPIPSAAPQPDSIIQGSSSTVAGYFAFEGLLRDTSSAAKPLNAVSGINISPSVRPSRSGASPAAEAGTGVRVRVSPQASASSTAVKAVTAASTSSGTGLYKSRDEDQPVGASVDESRTGNLRNGVDASKVMAPTHTRPSELEKEAAGPLQPDYDFQGSPRVEGAQPGQRTEPEPGSAATPRSANNAKRMESGSEEQGDAENTASRAGQPGLAQAGLGNSESGGVAAATNFTTPPSTDVRSRQQDSLPAPPSRDVIPDSPMPQATTLSGTMPAGGIRLAINENGQRVELRVMERAGDIHVAVRTPDAQLANTMHEQLPSLSSKLEQGGIHSEFWRPSAQSGENKPIETTGNMASDSRQESGERQQQQQSQHDEKTRQNLNRKSDRKEFSWLLESIR